MSLFASASFFPDAEATEPTLKRTNAATKEAASFLDRRAGLVTGSERLGVFEAAIEEARAKAVPPGRRLLGVIASSRNTRDGRLSGTERKLA